MKVDIQNNNTIENSNIGRNNIINNSDDKAKVWKVMIEIGIGIIVTVIGGYILYKLKIN